MQVITTDEQTEGVDVAVEYIAPDAARAITTPRQRGRTAPDKAMEIELDLEQMTIGDLELLDRTAKSQAPIGEVLDMLDRVVTGGARQLPITRFKQILTRLNIAVREAGNPKT